MPVTQLSRLLRDLRRGHSLTQAQVARALGVTVPSISSYENATVVPPEDRLDAYAVLFASPRCAEADAPAPVSHDFLRPSERKVYEELAGRFRTVTSRGASDTTVGFWRFPDDDAPIRVFVGRLDPDEVGPLARSANHNYTYWHNAADLDSLVELLAHLCQLNPDKNVEFRLGNHFTGEDLGAHMIVLGNIARTQGAGQLIPEGTLPVRQVPVDGLDGEIFEADQDGTIATFEPRIVDDRVVEDIGLLARRPNPHDPRLTLTVCSGVFARGVLGAVRSVTKEKFHDDNVQYVNHVIDDPGSFAVLFRVVTAGETVVTPRLQSPETVVHCASPVGSRSDPR